MATHSTFMDIEAYRQPVDPRRSVDGVVLVDRKPDFVFFASFPLFLGRGECKKTHFSYGKLRPERDAPWSRGQMAKAI